MYLCIPSYLAMLYAYIQGSLCTRLAQPKYPDSPLRCFVYVTHPVVLHTIMVIQRFFTPKNDQRQANLLSYEYFTSS